MTCPASNPKAPIYTCWQRIPDITDHMEIVRCQQCPHGRALIATVKRQPDADTDMAGAVEAPPQEDIIMEAQTYTVPKLAELLGVEAKHIYNARASKGIPASGSMKGIVLEGMRKRGITWDHVVTAPKGGGRKTSGAPSSDDGLGRTEINISTVEGTPEISALTPRKIEPVASKKVIMLDDWPLEKLMLAIKTKLPAHTSITINS